MTLIVQPIIEKKSADYISRKDVYYYNVNDMIPSSLTNIRDDMGDLEDLVQTIIESPDKIPPLRGYKTNGVIEITDGHRRRAAGVIAAERTGQVIALQFMAEPSGYTDVDRLTDMFLLNDGKKLTFLEQAKGIKRLIEEYGLSEREAAKRVHKSITYVKNSLKLLLAPDDIKEHLNNKFIAPTLVIDLMKEMPMEDVSRVLKDTADSMAAQPQQLSLSAAGRPERITPNSDDDDDLLSPSKSEDADAGQFRDSNEGGIIQPLKSSAHITRKDIDTHLEKFNSLQAYKNMLRRYPDTLFNMRPEMADELAFFQRVLEGSVNALDLWKRYFNNIDSREELESQLKS